MRNSVASLLFVASTALVSGCGVVYTSPNVYDDERAGSGTDLDVEVVKLTYATAADANMAPFTPARLPDFFKPAGASGNITSAATGPLDTESTPAAPRINMPAATIPDPYRIAIGDVVLISVDTTEVNAADVGNLIALQNKRQGYVVQDDGAIGIPNVGRVQVADRSMEEAEAQIFDLLISQNIDPKFSLEISEFNGRRFSVGGDVANPQVLPVTLAPMTISEALQETGGTTAVDDGHVTVRLYRDGRSYQVPLEQIYKNSRRYDLVLEDGDRLYVSAHDDFETNALQRAAYKDRISLDAVKRDYVYMVGNLKKQVRMPLPFEQTAVLSDVLAEAEGASIRVADWSQIYVLRSGKRPEEFGSATAYHLNARNAVNMLTAAKFEMRPGDVVFVAEQPITAWNAVVSQIVPNLFFQSAGFVAP